MPWALANASANLLRSPEPLRNTKLCKYHEQGACNRGNACAFAHCRQDLQKQPDLFKTSFCRKFLRSGKCHRGGRCKFAHFKQEFRAITQTKQPGAGLRCYGDAETMSSFSMGPSETASTSHLSQSMAPGYFAFKQSQGQAAKEIARCPDQVVVDALPNQTHERLQACLRTNKPPRECRRCPTEGYLEWHVDLIIESLQL
eukprot:TRINITY_DN21191_c1_g1_i1.p1 TRINITY_DN21191_c1_g1~~TRINITY_DN21191_c1_g1_i1.p1  ORF type:complete len:200 (-),score=18.85 TRINITY_DN21191_c1_g1_i1:316-915(-)